MASPLAALLGALLYVAGLTSAYKDTIMPSGTCNITAAATSNLTVPNPIQENAHIIATFWSAHYGTHVIVLVRDTKLYHKHQTAPNASADWSAWKCLTPDLSKIACSTAPACGGFDNSPVVNVDANGTATVFVRQMSDLDIFETHLEDPADPDSWSALRPPACICNYPPCANQTKCGVALCDEKGVDCSVEPTTSDAYWSYGPFFPTSELSLLREGDSLALYYRGFDGGYYKSLQSNPGDPAKFVYPPTRLGGFDGGENAIIE